MLFLKHDFYSNFSSSIESGDNDFITDILVDELSEIIVYQRESLIELFNKIGIEVSDKISDEKLVDLIIKNISENVKLAKGLAFLIAQNNENVKGTRVVKGSNGKETVMKSGVTPATLSQIDMLRSGIVGIADSFKYKPQLEKEFKIKLMEKIKTKIKAVGDRKIKHTESNNGKYVLLAILLIGGALGVYFYLKNKKKKAAEGMEIEGGETIDTSTIETPIPSEPTPAPVETPPAPVEPTTATTEVVTVEP